VALAGPAAPGDAFTPLKVDDKVYVSTPISNKVVAVKLDQGPSVAWTHLAAKEDPTVIPVMCCDAPNAGRLAYADGKVFKYEADTTLIALDAQTGKEVWKTRTGNPKMGEEGDRVPYVMGDKVLVGVSPMEFGGRSYVTAFNVKDGAKAWKGYSVGPDQDILVNPKMTMANGKPVGPDSGIKTWSADQWKTRGGQLSSKLVYDREQKLMYYVTGEPEPLQPQVRDWPSSETVFARAIDSGEAKWVFRLPPIEDWDTNVSADLTLTEKQIKGEKRKVLDYRDTSGRLFTLDRETGVLVETTKIKASTMSQENKYPFEIDPSQLR
jgi:glucose dehydrogenase